MSIPDWSLEYAIKIEAKGIFSADDIPDAKFVRYSDIAKLEIERYKEIIYSEAKRLDEKILERLNKTKSQIDQASSASEIRDEMAEALSAPTKMVEETSLSINNALKALRSAIEVKVQEAMTREAREDKFLVGARVEVGMKLLVLALTIGPNILQGILGNPVKLIGSTCSIFKTLKLVYKECRESFRSVEESRDECLKAVAIAKRKYDSGLNQVLLAALDDAEKIAKKRKMVRAFALPTDSVVDKVEKAYFAYKKLKEYDTNGLIDMKALKKAFYEFGSAAIEPIRDARRNYEVKVIKLRKQSDEISAEAKEALECAQDKGMPRQMRNDIKKYHDDQQNIANEILRTYTEHLKMLANIDRALLQMGEDPEKILRNKYFDGLTDLVKGLTSDRISDFLDLEDTEQMLTRLIT